jgi:hypothetical protein
LEEGVLRDDGVWQRAVIVVEWHEPSPPPDAAHRRPPCLARWDGALWWWRTREVACGNGHWRRVHHYRRLVPFIETCPAPVKVTADVDTTPACTRGERCPARWLLTEDMDAWLCAHPRPG